MQISSLLFVQLPAFVANLTNPTSSSSSAPAVATPPTHMAFQRHQFELPPLPYAYNALEPYISEQIMKLHHQKHHQAYVTNLNAATSALITALNNGDVKIALQAAIKFHGGGHINHSLFWPSLCPPSSPASDPSSAPSLVAAINAQFSSLDAFKAEMKAVLLGIQGSGWGWVVKNSSGGLELVTTKDQDPVEGKEVVFGIDMWEHAYYLQYWNDKAAYVNGIWNVVNWEVAERRFRGEVGELKL